jgi:mannose-6-phosphate isomerase-like protein (cupin superfamily)
MSLTYIDTSKIPRRMTEQGEVAEVLNEALCGARNVRASLRRLKSAEAFSPQPEDKHQLIYFMEGRGRIRLNDRDYDVEKGAGIYLGPTETATIQETGGASLKLFHLVVPQIPK